MSHRPLLAAAISVLIGMASQSYVSHADSIVVDRADDAPWATACTSAPDDCSLRGAVIKLNGLQGETHSILIAGERYALTALGPDEDGGLAGDLDIRAQIEIVGLDPQRSVIQGWNDGGGPRDRVFHIHPGARLTLSRVMVHSGRAERGGGILVEAGATAVLRDVIVSGNEAHTGAGIHVRGGLYAIASTISANTADEAGGGIGIGQTADEIRIRDSTVSGNSAMSGAGIHLEGGRALIQHATIAENRSGDPGAGAGLHQTGAAVVRLGHSLLVGNITVNADNSCAGAAASDGFNLATDGSCRLDGPGDLVSSDARVGPLGLNGGRTPTHALLAGSPAIDGGAPESQLAEWARSDQRGEARPARTSLSGTPRADIGAYESPSDACSPRPPVVVRPTLNTSRLDVAIRAGRGTLRAIQIGDATQQPSQPVNAIISLNGQTLDGTTTDPITLNGVEQDVQLTVRANAPGRPSSVPLIVFDECGAWHTSVGGTVEAATGVDRPRSPTAQAGSAGPTSSPGLVLTAADVSPPLRSITPNLDRAPTLGRGRERVIRRRTITEVPQETQRTQAAPNDAAPARRMPAPLLNFPGVTAIQAGQVAPPDINGDVGINHFVQWVNVAFAIYDKSGTMLHPVPLPGNVLWAGLTLPGGLPHPCSLRNDGDPIVLYDRAADRWLLSQFTTASPFQQCIAVSTSGDPLGTYYRYGYQWSLEKFNDYPKFGIWPDGYYVAVNQFDDFTYRGAGVAAFERSKLLTGQVPQTVYFDLEFTQPASGGLLPAHLTGSLPPPVGAPNYFVEIADPSLGFSGADRLNIFEFHVDWTNIGLSTFTGPLQVATAAFDPNLCFATQQQCIPQLNSPAKLDALSDRAMYRLHYRNFGTHQTMVLNHTVDENSLDHAAIRWYELRKTAGAWGMHQQGTFAPDAAHRWMGSANVDKDGNLAVGYTASSSTTFPSIRYAGRLSTDPLGTLGQGETVMFAGTGSQIGSSNRWGDYSSLSIDPTDDCTFWLTHQYYESTSAFNWKTRVGTFRFESCQPPPPCPTRQPVQISVVPAGVGILSVTVTPGTGSLGSIQFLGGGNGQVPQPNASVTIGTFTNRTGTWTYTFPPSTMSVNFSVTRVTPGQPVTLPMVVSDGCGAFNTFVGGGAGAF